MAIVRTPLIDDDGSGETGTILNNAWQNGLYNAIDAAILPTYGTWTPTDGSGAGLVFQAGTTGTWAKDGRIVAVWAQVIYPVTSNSAQAGIAGLPFINRVPAGAVQGYGPHRIWWLAQDTSSIIPLDPATSAVIPNSAISGTNSIVSAVYLTD